MLQIFYCKTCYNPHTEYLCHSYNGLCCTNCCPCTDKINGDGKVTFNDNGDIWILTHEIASNIFTPVEFPDPSDEVVLEDIVNDPTSPNYIGDDL
jgi:hypothetical protein